MHSYKIRLDLFLWVLFFYGIYFNGANNGQFLSPVIFNLVFLISSILVLFSLKNEDISYKLRHPLLGSFLFFYSLYSLSLLFSTILYSGKTIVSTFDFVKFIYFLVVGIIFFLLVNREFTDFFLDSFGKVTYITSLLGIIGFTISLFFDLPIIKEVNLDGRLYQFRLFFWNLETMDSSIAGSNIFIPVLNKTIYRFQGWFDEPGTFAFLTIPGFYWYRWVKKDKFKSVVILISILASLSFGGLLVLVLVEFLIKITDRKYTIILTILIFIIIQISLLIIFDESDNWFTSYMQVKLGIGPKASNVSSFGVRSNEYSLVRESLSQKPFGYGYGNLMLAFGHSVSSSIVGELTIGGITGFISRVLLELPLLIYSGVSLLNKKCDKRVFFGASILCLLIMGYQRSSFLSTFWGLIFIMVTLNGIFYLKDTNNG